MVQVWPEHHVHSAVNVRKNADSDNSRRQLMPPPL